MFCVKRAPWEDICHLFLVASILGKVAKRGLCMTQTGTPYYASPEVWRDMPYDAAVLLAVSMEAVRRISMDVASAKAKSDMWSLGCILYAAQMHPCLRFALNLKQTNVDGWVQIG